MMIITPDEKSDSPSDVKGPIPEGPEHPEEPPPSYSSQVASGSAAGASTSPFQTKPTNFLSLYNSNDSIKGQFVIDPSIVVPSTMLPPLCDGETDADRKNLSLRSKNGSVRAEIWLLGSPREEPAKARRTTLALTSNHGSINTQLHTVDVTTSYSLTACSPHGSVRVTMPRSFQGLLYLTTRHGGVHLSDAVIGHATQLSQVDDTRRYFIGDFSLLGEDEWQGDQMALESTHGSVHVKYVEEMVDGQCKKGFLSRLFGR